MVSPFLCFPKSSCSSWFDFFSLQIKDCKYQMKANKQKGVFEFWPSHHLSNGSWCKLLKNREEWVVCLLLKETIVQFSLILISFYKLVSLLWTHIYFLKQPLHRTCHWFDSASRSHNWFRLLDHFSALLVVRMVSKVLVLSPQLGFGLRLCSSSSSS